MKVRITDPEVIRKQERELFASIVKNLDWEALSRVFRSHHRLGSISEMASREGDFVARKEEVAYRLEFDVRAVLSVVFDRSGNYLDTGDAVKEVEVHAPQENFRSEDGFGGPPDDPDPSGAPVASASEETETIELDQIVRERSDMITEPSLYSKTPPKPAPTEKMSRMASELAGMISDINGKKKK